MSPARRQVPLGEWTFSIGAQPRLTLFEKVGRSGSAIVWARWYDPHARGGLGAPRTKSTQLSIRYSADHRRAGQINPEFEQAVIALAQAWHNDLRAGREPGASPGTNAASEDEKAALTIAEGFELYTHPVSGRYVGNDPARSDVIAAGRDCVAALGEHTTWASVVPMAAAESIWRYVYRRIATNNKVRTGVRDLKKLNKRRRNHALPRRVPDGATWARRCVNHFFACAEWLATRGKIPADACRRPSGWVAEFKADWRRLSGRDLDTERDGPRYTPDEAGRLLNALFDPRIDPRLRLAILCGADSLRGGQVTRTMRSQLDLSQTGAFGKGRLVVLGRGKKMGAIVDLDEITRSQLDHEMRAGYLRECEAAYLRGDIEDYALFPQGRFVGGAIPVRHNERYLKPISRRAVTDFFLDLERVAGVEHVPGRGWYGLRRLWADLTPEHVHSVRGREVMGGWARGSKVIDRVYKSKEDEQAIREAALGRAAIREALRTGRLSDVTALRTKVVQAVATADADTLRRILSLLSKEDPSRE